MGERFQLWSIKKLSQVKQHPKPTFLPAQDPKVAITLETATNEHLLKKGIWWTKCCCPSVFCVVLSKTINLGAFGYLCNTKKIPANGL